MPSFQIRVGGVLIVLTLVFVIVVLAYVLAYIFILRVDLVFFLDFVSGFVALTINILVVDIGLVDRFHKGGVYWHLSVS